MTFDLRCLSGTAEPGASAARSRPARKVSGPGTVGRQSGVLSSASAATNRAFQMVDLLKYNMCLVTVGSEPSLILITDTNTFDEICFMKYTLKNLKLCLH